MEFYAVIIILKFSSRRFRLLYDDAFGVGEPLNESAYGVGLVARGRHVVQLTEGASAQNGEASRRHRLAAQQEYLGAVVAVAVDRDRIGFDKWRARYIMERYAVGERLPTQVHLLTMEEWHGNSRDSVLMR